MGPKDYHTLRQTYIQVHMVAHLPPLPSRVCPCVCVCVCVCVCAFLFLEILRTATEPRIKGGAKIQKKKRRRVDPKPI